MEGVKGGEEEKGKGDTTKGNLWLSILHVITQNYIHTHTHTQADAFEFKKYFNRLKPN